MYTPHAIVRLLMDDEVPQPPDDTGFDVDLDNFSTPENEFRGVSPINVYQRFLDELRGKRRKTLPSIKATVIELHPDQKITLSLYDTTLIEATPDNTITFSTDGFFTKLTMERLNTYTDGGWRLFSQNGKLGNKIGGAGTRAVGQILRIGEFYWYNYSTHEGMRHEPGKPYYRIPFTDGDYITADGTLHTVKPGIKMRSRK